MALRQREWASRARATLIQQLGGQCWACGSVFDLQFDHPNGRDWIASTKEFSWRISIYRREAREGKIRLLCGKCNDSQRFDGVVLEKPAENPF